MRIQHNIPAMNAYRNYNNNTKALSGNLEKLSSGYKINRAGDDAAGLAISEKMRAQITGLDAAQKNVKDGVSLVKTAEGTMQEIQDMLKRMKYLATQSANGTYQDDVDRDNLQKEVQSLRAEINRIADSANFNGINLLDGSMSVDGKAATPDTAAYNAAANAGIETLEETGNAIPAYDPGLATVAAGNEEIPEFEAGKAVSKKDPEYHEGLNGSNATNAKITLDLKTALSSFTGASLQNAMVTIGNKSVAISEAFDIQIYNKDGDLELDGEDAWANSAITGGKIVLTAKVAGELGDDAIDFLKVAVSEASGGAVTASGWTDVADVEDGLNAGSSREKHEITFNAKDIQSGNYLKIGGSAIQFTANGDTSSTDFDVAVQLSNDMDVDQFKKDLKAALSNAIGSDWKIQVSTSNEEKDDNGKVINADFSIKLVAVSASDAQTGVAAKVETDIANAAHTAEGIKPADKDVYATAKIKIDTAAITNGDQLVFGSGDDAVKITIVDSGATPVTAKGEITLTDLQTDGKLNTLLTKLGYGKNVAVTNGGISGNTVYTFTVSNQTGGKLEGADLDKFKADTAITHNRFIPNKTSAVSGSDVTITLSDSFTVTGGSKLNETDVKNLKNIGKIRFGGDEGDDMIIDFAKDITVAKGDTVKDVQARLKDVINQKMDAWNKANPTLDQYDTSKTEVKIENGNIVITTEATEGEEPTTPDTPVTPGAPGTTTIASNGKSSTASGVGAGSALPDLSIGNATISADQMATVKGLSFTIGKNENAVAVDFANFNSSATTAADLKKDMQAYIAKAVTDAGKANVYDVSGNGSKIKIEAAPATAAAAADLNTGYNITVSTVSNVKRNPTTGAVVSGGNSGATDDGESKPLTLQIGDTSDDFNKMKVSIGDMHTWAMGRSFKAETDSEGVTSYAQATEDEAGKNYTDKTIYDIDIGEQDSASEAVKVITNAINYVSSVRGDLGAVQNRLEHTQNNLSVMAENITDAESTIRDTDVASEMMSYVKNNILVQSAQAMLAQANQLPQGVLQLLG